MARKSTSPTVRDLLIGKEWLRLYTACINAAETNPTDRLVLLTMASWCLEKADAAVRRSIAEEQKLQTSGTEIKANNVENKKPEGAAEEQDYIYVLLAKLMADGQVDKEDYQRWKAAMRQSHLLNNFFSWFGVVIPWEDRIYWDILMKAYDRDEDVQRPTLEDLDKMTSAECDEHVRGREARIERENRSVDLLRAFLDELAGRNKARQRKYTIRFRWVCFFTAILWVYGCILERDHEPRLGS